MTKLRTLKATEKNSRTQCFEFADYLAALFLFVLLAWMYCPGYMSFDSNCMLRLARGEACGSTHPMMMPYLWRQLLPISNGPFPMLLVHIALFVGGLYLVLLSVVATAPARAIWAAGIAFFPIIVNQQGFLWKDIGLASSLLMASGILLHARGRRWIVMLSLPFLIYGGMVRHNGIIAAFPLVLWFLFEIKPQAFSSFRSRVIGVLVLGMIILTAANASKFVSFTHVRQLMKGVMLYDLGGMSLRANISLIPDFGNGSHQLESLRVSFRPTAAGAVAKDLSPVIKTEAEYVRLADAWLHAIIEHPLLWLKTRWDFFSYLLGVKAHTDCPVDRWIPPPDFNGRLYGNSLREKVLLYTDKSLESPVLKIIWRGWLWLLLLLLFIGTSIFRQKLRPFSWIAVSGFLYTAAYFFIGLSCDFRYMHWSMLAAILTAVGFLEIFIGKYYSRIFHRKALRYCIVIVCICGLAYVAIDVLRPAVYLQGEFPRPHSHLSYGKQVVLTGDTEFGSATRELSVDVHLNGHQLALDNRALSPIEAVRRHRGPVLSGRISGDGSIHIRTASIPVQGIKYNMRFDGEKSNSFTGKFVVSVGIVELARKSNETVISGDLILHGTEDVTGLIWFEDNQIDDEVSVTVLGNQAAFYLNHHMEQVGVLRLQGDLHIVLDCGAQLLFASSGSERWDAGARLIVVLRTPGGCDQEPMIGFGHSPAALTVSQLAQVHLLESDDLSVEHAAVLGPGGTLMPLKGNSSPLPEE